MRLSWHWVKLFPYLQNLNLRNKKKGLVPRLHESYCEKLTQIWDALIVITGPCLIQFNSKILYSLIVAIFGLFLFWAVWNAWMICGIVTDLMLFWNLMVEDFFFFFTCHFTNQHTVLSLNSVKSWRLDQIACSQFADIGLLLFMWTHPNLSAWHVHVNTSLSVEGLVDIVPKVNE